MVAIHSAGLIVTLHILGFWGLVIYAIFNLLNHAKATRQALNRLEIKLDRLKEDLDRHDSKPS
jgi:hypothetical protein